MGGRTKPRRWLWGTLAIHLFFSSRRKYKLTGHYGLDSCYMFRWTVFIKSQCNYVLLAFNSSSAGDHTSCLFSSLVFLLSHPCDVPTHTHTTRAWSVASITEDICWNMSYVRSSRLLTTLVVLPDAYLHFRFMSPEATMRHTFNTSLKFDFWGHLLGLLRRRKSDFSSHQMPLIYISMYVFGRSHPAAYTQLLKLEHWLMKSSVIPPHA